MGQALIGAALSRSVGACGKAVLRKAKGKTFVRREAISPPTLKILG